MLLRQLGYAVVAKNSPHQALKLFQADPAAFDLVLTDQAMPEMNGIELASQIAQIRPDIPIILCTGYDPTASYGTDANGQIADYITELAIKPLERHELLAVLARVFNGLPDKGTD
jgi:CheY-like chemotaxis protein